MPTIFQPPRAFIPNASGVKYAGAKAYFYITGTTTPKDTYTDFALTTPSANPVVADSNGDWATIYLKNDVRYRVTLKTSAGVEIYTQDDVGGPVLSLDEWGQIGYPRTSLEVAAGITPTNHGYIPGDIRRYGAAVSPADATAAVRDAAATGHSVFIPAGQYDVNGGQVTLSTAGQTMYGEGATKSILVKSTNGDLITVAANYVTIKDIQANNNSSGTLTGYNVYGNVVTKLVLLRCVFHKSATNCVRVKQPNSCAIEDCYIDNSTAAAGTPPVYWGDTGLGTYAGLYNHITGCQIQPSGNPIKFDAIGTSHIVGNQIGGFDNNTAGGTTGGSELTANRITGPVTDDGPNAVYIGNVIGAYSCTLEAASSGAMWIANQISGGGSITNSGTSNIVSKVDSNGLFQWLQYTSYINNTGIKFYDSAGTNFGSLFMSSGNNLSYVNNNGGLQLGASSGNAVQLLVNGVEQFKADGGYIKSKTTTVGSLVAAATAGAGARSFVTDSNATTFNNVVAGGGANGVPVFSDGTNWRIG